MDKSETIMYYLRNTATETIAHLYWKCTHNRRLWEREVIVDPTEMVMGVSHTETARPGPQPAPPHKTWPTARPAPKSDCGPPRVVRPRAGL